MSDEDLLVSSGTCYSAAGKELDSSFIPCGNDAFGHVTCCGKGDNCLADNACYGVHGQGDPSQYGHMLTYMAGCTDPDYEDSSCPDKKGIDDNSWIALTLCDDTDVWAACSQPGNPSTLQPGATCTCTVVASATVAFSDASSLDNLASLPQNTGDTISFFAGHTPTTPPGGPTGGGTSASGDTTGTTGSTAGPTTFTTTGADGATVTVTQQGPTQTVGGDTGSGSGLGQGAAIGIGVGVGVGAILILLALGAILWRRRKRRREQPRDDVKGAVGGKLQKKGAGAALDSEKAGDGADGTGASKADKLGITETDGQAVSEADSKGVSKADKTAMAEAHGVPVVETDGHAVIRPHSLRSELQGSPVTPTVPDRHADGTHAAHVRTSADLSPVAEIPGAGTPGDGVTAASTTGAPVPAELDSQTFPDIGGRSSYGAFRRG
ncbi:hypothetical protein F5Y18DRAFT_51465 [Xylariaceae sp. FL1019]|nr:hypothetical protein F5Y18DRAFT_51465 [Xylariaceae sp. FL1019]